MRKKQKKKTAKKRASKADLNRPDTSVVRGLVFLTLGLAFFLSLLSFAYDHQTTNRLGLVGHASGKLFHLGLGLGSYFLVPYFLWIGWRLVFSKPINHLFLKTTYLSTAIFSFCILLSAIENQFPRLGAIIANLFYSKFLAKDPSYHLGGMPFYYIYHDIPVFSLSRLLNTSGVFLVFSTTFLASVFFLFKLYPLVILKKLVAGFLKIKEKFEAEKKDAALAREQQAVNDESYLMRYVNVRIPEGPQANAQVKEKHTLSQSLDLLAITPETRPTVRPSLSQKKKLDTSPLFSSEEKRAFIQKKDSPLLFEDKENSLFTPSSKEEKKQAAVAAQKVYNGDFSGYALPGPSMLSSAKKVDSSTLKQDLRRQAEVLEETLSSFGIEAKVGQINCGPTITSFEVHPAIGVKVQKIKALENDIALNMEAKSIRIIAPIPGKAAVGIEVPNPNPQEVAFKDMITAYQQGSRKFHIPILLGKAVSGEYVMSDLAKMPHCIIAGATGSGKSVCINTIVMSILMNAKPDEVRLLMVDPKKVELTPYSNLPHMLAPVITEPLGAYAALNWLVKEMENRYEILKQLGLRNIEAFNGRNPSKELEASLNIAIPEKMYYIVGIIDELADLMMVASHDIETPIARIAQMARAVGIHLILATQRPSREVITGLIKANFPTRISFKVASRVNSQIVLDETGAESLLGNGDMLFLPPGTSNLVRAQGAFIRDEDINAVVKQICDQAPPNHIIASFDKVGTLENDLFLTQDDSKPADSLYDQAKDIVIGSGNASTTFLQRKLKIGYARAASLMDELEAKGVISAPDGSKARKVLAGRAPFGEDNQPLIDDDMG